MTDIDVGTGTGTNNQKSNGVPVSRAGPQARPPGLPSPARSAGVPCPRRRGRHGGPDRVADLPGRPLVERVRQEARPDRTVCGSRTLPISRSGREVASRCAPVLIAHDRSPMTKPCRARPCPPVRLIPMAPENGPGWVPPVCVTPCGERRWPCVAACARGRNLMVFPHSDRFRRPVALGR